MSNTNDVRGAEDKTDTWRDDVVAMIPHLRAVAQSLSRNAADADDLVQECLIKAWSHRESFTPGTNLRAWLFTILRNTFYTMTRKRQREVADASGAYAATLRSEPVQEWRAQLEDLRRALDRTRTFLRTMPQWKEHRPSILRPKFAKNLELGFLF